MGEGGLNFFPMKSNSKKGWGGGYHLFLPLITLSNVIFICVCVSRTQQKKINKIAYTHCLLLFVCSICFKREFFFTIEIVLRLPYNNLNRIIILLKCGFHLSRHVTPGNAEEEKCLERFHTFHAIPNSH